MFWKKKSLANQTGPFTVPNFVGDKIATSFQTSPDFSNHWVKYKGVVRLHAGEKGGCDIRIFDEWETNQTHIKVIDYAFLDTHTDLVHFEGWFDYKTRTAEINDVRKPNKTAGK
jgi:hypothetical protein